MNPIREDVLFALTLEKPAEKRAAFLGVICEGDAALRARLDALLAAHEALAGILGDEPGAGNRKDQLHQSPTQAQGPTQICPPPEEAIGTTLGRYKLRERVGEGGWGTVYVAEQTEPVRRRVALKVIKLGMDTRRGLKGS